MQFVSQTVQNDKNLTNSLVSEKLSKMWNASSQNLEEYPSKKIGKSLGGKNTKKTRLRPPRRDPPRGSWTAETFTCWELWEFVEWDFPSNKVVFLTKKKQ